jgi:hypothetical protein
MARVRISVRNLRASRHTDAPDPQPESLPVVSTDGALPLVRYLPWYRLMVRVFVEPIAGEVLETDIAFDAILDTGAPLTTFPFEVWNDFRDHIRWLDQPPREDVDEGGNPMPWQISVGGGTWDYRLGRLRLGLTDGGRGLIPAEMTTRLFLVPPPPGPRPPRQAVLGLRSPLLDRRQLRHTGTISDSPEWWLEDA